MSAVTIDSFGGGAELRSGKMTPAMQGGIALAAFVVGLGINALLGGMGPVKTLIGTAVAFPILTYAVARQVEGRRLATDRLATTLAWMAFGLVMLPLVSLVWTVVTDGAARMDATFFTETMQGVVSEGGGIRHALTGTLIVTGIAAAFSIPFGLFTAIYLVEYADGKGFSRWITMLVDVMTGIPSIVAGLFAYGLFVALDAPGHRSGLAAGVALTVLMTPVVVRSSEEMLRLVQDELREAAYALGVPKWKTIVKVVLPTAIGGILTGATLAIARVIGETAPLLVTAGTIKTLNANPIEGRMETLPIYSYYSYKTPTIPPELSYERMWASALVLMIVVAVLFSLARVLAAVLKPKGLR